MKPVVAIVGRPNVGKSTLFNRILGRRAALVANLPGLTRDRNYAEAEHTGRVFTIVDTGGFDPHAKEGMLALMKAQVALAVEESDALIVVMDAREGLTPLDEAVWSIVRESRKRAYLAINKVDRPSDTPVVSEFYRLGVEELFPVSAENGGGVAELLDRVVQDLAAPAAEDLVAPDEAAGPIRVAVIGRPNVGKSTFANAWLGRERFLTSNEPGTTRDSVDASIVRDGREYVLVDTAGIRRRRSVEAGIERMSVARAIQAMERSHVTALVLDAVQGVTDQDKRLAALAIERGRGLIVLVNKWDLVHDGPKAGDEYARRLDDELAFASFAPRLFVSAWTGRNVGRFLPLVNRVFQNLFRRIPTHELNAFYREVIQARPPTVSGTRTARIRYLTQVEVNPPTILLFHGGAPIPNSYLRFVQNQLRVRYDFEGVPIRLIPK